MVGSNIGTLNVTALTNNADVMVWTRTGEGDVIYSFNRTISLVGWSLRVEFYLENKIKERHSGTNFCISIEEYDTVKL
jgi:3-dehydroquinate synthase class II